MPRYTKEEYQAAVQVDLLKFIQSRHHVEKAGKNYRLRDHDSFVIFPENGAYWFSREMRIRDPVDFLVKYEEMTVPEAVRTICDDYLRGRLEGPAKFMPRKSEPKRRKEEFILPRKLHRTQEVMDYLTRVRMLDPEIVQKCLDNESIYQSVNFVNRGDGRMIYYNCVFVGFDEQGNPRSATQRGMRKDFQFRGDVNNSEKIYGFSYGNPDLADILCVFEAPIDALSYATLMKGQDAKPDRYLLLSMGGLSGEVIQHYLQNHPQVKTVQLCTDNDEAGRSFAQRQEKALAEQGVNVVIAHPPAGKDYNEYLCELKREALTYRPFPKPVRDDRQMMDHLVHKRMLSPSLLAVLKERGILFQSDIARPLPDGSLFENSTMVFCGDCGYAMQLPLALTQNATDYITEHGIENEAGALKIEGANSGADQLLVFDNPISMLSHLNYVVEHNLPSNCHYLCRHSHPESAAAAYMEEHPEIGSVTLIFERDGATRKRADGTLDRVDFREQKILDMEAALEDYPVQVKAKLRSSDLSFQNLYRDMVVQEKAQQNVKRRR